MPRLLSLRTATTAMLAVLFTAGISHGAATFIPEFPLGSCGTGDGAPACVWSCEQDSDHNPGCLCSGSTTDTCLEDAECTSNSCPTCALDFVTTFAARLVIQIEDAECPTETDPNTGLPIQGSIVTFALRGQKADGSEFTVTSKELDLRCADITCDSGCDTACPVLDANAPQTPSCEPHVCDPFSGNSPNDLSCPLAMFLGCASSVQHVDETNVTTIADWLQNQQPVFDYLINELTGPNGVFPSANPGRPVVVSVASSQVTDNSINSGTPAEKSQLDACVTMGILRDVRAVTINGDLSAALTNATTSTFTIPDLDGCGEAGTATPTPTATPTEAVTVTPTPTLALATATRTPTPTPTANGALGRLRAAVQALPLSAFKARGLQNAMLSILTDIAELLAAGDTSEAVQKLENLRRHVDGCPPTRDTNDWIVDCAAQTQIRQLIDDAIADIQ